MPTPTESPTSTPTALPSPEPATDIAPDGIIGIGILGDSNSDEYRANDNRGGAFADVTLNWVEQLAINRNLNFGEWGDWEPPRRTGYAYNWARSGATAESMIRSGQHLGLAGQIAAGQVSHAIIFIGGNDFNQRRGIYADIYNDALTAEAITDFVDGFVGNVTTAVDTLLAAGDIKIIIVAPADPGLNPAIANRYPEAEGRQRASDVIAEVNQRLGALADSYDNVTAVYLSDVAEELVALLNEDGLLELGGQEFDPFRLNNEPTALRLDDLAGHAGTVLSGLLANAIFVTPMNEAFGHDIMPLAQEEILANAGLD